VADTFLDRIVAATRAELGERRARIPLDELRARAGDAPAPRAFAEALRPTPGGPARLIAEVKRASPSKGIIADQFKPVAQARAYERGGAAAISVLTEPRFFLGALEHLTAIRAAVSLPVLRKDFILDAYQIYETRAAGADAILLICALLDDAQLADLLALTRALGMEALVEAHTVEETRRAERAGAAVLGANSRDLRTFAVDANIIQRLRPGITGDATLVAESGIADALGAARARAWGAEAILVGEALMRSPDPAAKARELVCAPGGGPIRAFFAGSRQPLIKICGLTTPEQVAQVDRLCAASLCIDAFGLVLAPSRRRVTQAQAARIMKTRPGGRETRAVGVFVNEPAKHIARVARALALGAVQCSGDEAPEACAEVAAQTGLPVLKALRLRTRDDLGQLDAYALAGAVPLLDTPTATGVYGGTGTIGDWELAREAAVRWPTLLSGGLTPANVADALRVVNPRGVDVSSGVETDGVKDLAKIRAFIAAARRPAETAPAPSREVSV
jgi:indole-3-glycerol phosphate synthase / phosphoribosylanthranilate isomerase